MFKKTKVIMYGGIPILYKKNKVNNTTDLRFGITTGAFNEHHEGVAHFYEHIMFKQTETKNLQQLGEIISDVTPDIGAATGYDRMYIYANFSSRKIEDYVSVMSDMFFHSKNAQEDIDKECKVICQEINRVGNDAHRQASFLNYAISTKEPRFAFSACGSEKNVKTIKSKDLFKFREQNFYKENFLFSIYTNKSLRYVKKLVDTYILPNLPSKKDVTKKLEADVLYNQKNAVKNIQKIDVTKNNLLLSFNGFNQENELYRLVFNFYVFRSLAKMKGRLWNRMREEESLVYATPRCYADINLKDGMVCFAFETTKENIMRCIEIWAEIVEDLHKNGITKEEYNFCKTEMTLEKDFDYEKPTGHAGGMFNTYSAYHKLFKHNEMLNKALALDFETVNEVVKQIFVPKNVWLSCFGNASKKELPTVARLEKLFIKK